MSQQNVLRQAQSQLKELDALLDRHNTLFNKTDEKADFSFKQQKSNETEDAASALSRFQQSIENQPKPNIPSSYHYSPSTEEPFKSVLRDTKPTTFTYPPPENVNAPAASKEVHPLSESFHETPLELRKSVKPPAPVITEQQMRALSKKHLFMMIRDLEAELQQVKEENKKLLFAFQAGLTQQKN